MFYEKQPKQNQENYKNMLKIVGSLSNLFSDSESPSLYYRAHENIFCRYFEAENTSRKDNSADAVKDGLGIGLKTWVYSNNQKVAEFGKLKPRYENLTGLNLVTEIAKYRNERIRVTMNMHKLSNMIYHVVKRVPNEMQILETSFDFIDIENIQIIPNKGNQNNIYFTDGKRIYHFSTSKNTLYMLFNDMELLDSFRVDFLDDPYTLLEDFYKNSLATTTQKSTPKKEKLCLRLYKQQKDGTKQVPAKSGLNQWNAKGRPRNVNELYIPYPSIDRHRNPDFFPPRDTPFVLVLPDGTEISAKVCQGASAKLSTEKYNKLSDEEKAIRDKKALEGKAIMSNPNNVLGKWLLRDVLEIPEKQIVTYEMLEVFNIDSVMFTKLEDNRYSIDFCELGTYEKTYENNK